MTDIAEISPEHVEKLNRQNVLFQIQGVYEYCDSLENHVCRQFTMFYQGEPFRRFNLASDYKCPSFATEIASPDPSLEYLPPCESMTEQKAGKGAN
jgi:hypothetical protein